MDQFQNSIYYQHIFVKKETITLDTKSILEVCKSPAAKITCFLSASFIVYLNIAIPLFLQMHTYKHHICWQIFVTSKNISTLKNLFYGYSTPVAVFPTIPKMSLKSTLVTVLPFLKTKFFGFFFKRGER